MPAPLVATYLVANAAWVVTFGDQVLALEGHWVGSSLTLRNSIIAWASVASSGAGAIASPWSSSLKELEPLGSNSFHTVFSLGSSNHT